MTRRLTAEAVQVSGRTGRERLRSAVLTAAAALAVLSAAGCAGETIRHGQYFAANDLQQIQPGMSQEQVRLTLGTPNTTSTIDGGAYYYISTTKKQVSFFKPETTDRQVVAVYFDTFGTVERVANYGLEDGNVIDFNDRKTPAQIADKSLIAQMFRGIGRQKVGNDDDG